MIGFLAAIIAMSPIYLIRLHIFNLPTTLLEVLVVVFLFIKALRFKIKDFGKLKSLGKINWAIGLFVLAGIISIFVSAEHFKALGLFRAFILEPVLMFYAIIITIQTKDDLRIVLRCLFWANVLVSALGIIQYFTLIHLPLRFWGNGEEVRRITSIFDYPNALSLYLGPLFGLFAALWFKNYSISKNKITSFAGLLVIGAALILTFSRGAWIAVAIALILVLINRFGIKKVAIPALVVILLMSLIPKINNRLGLSDPSSVAHVSLLKTGVNQIITHPIFGLGLGGFGLLNLEVNYPHNILLNFWSELGLLGLISFIWILFLALQRYKKSQTVLTFAASISLLIIIIHGLVDVPYFKNDLSLLFWFVIALFYL